jgi:hypothetical protein
MSTLKIIEHLLNEKHLEPRELGRAWVIVNDLKEILEYRTGGETND